MLALYSTKAGTPGKPKPQTKAHYYILHSLGQKKELRWKNMQPENAMGSKERPLMKEEATPKRKRLKRKTFDKKRGNHKTQGTQKKDLWLIKRQPQNTRGSK
jgi:hypothetical protein